MKPHLFLLDHFNNMKIGKKIMLAFVMASIVPILAIQFIGYRMNSNSLKRKIDTLMVDNLTQLSERVDLTMGMVDSTHMISVFLMDSRKVLSCKRCWK